MCVCEFRIRHYLRVAMNSLAAADVLTIEGATTAAVVVVVYYWCEAAAAVHDVASCRVVECCTTGGSGGAHKTQQRVHTHTGNYETHIHIRTYAIPSLSRVAGVRTCAALLRPLESSNRRGRTALDE